MTTVDSDPRHHPMFVHDPRLKIRSISMGDEMYEACVEIAGPRKFSTWVRDLLQLEINRYRNIKGRVPGGPCDSGLGCTSAGAWYLHTLKHNYWCEECFSKSNSQYLFADKSPVAASGAGGKREDLVHAVVRAAKALSDYDSAVATPVTED